MRDPAGRSLIVEMEKVSKSFGPIQALAEASFSMKAGEIRALCGENGAGKSTLVKLLMGLVHPDAGHIRLFGRPVQIRNSAQAQRLGLGLVSQELSLAPHLSVVDNIWLGSPDVPILHRRRELRARARAALQALQLELDLDTPVGTLGVAQQQMVELARLIAREARLLILDEPSATLSDAEIAQMMRVLRALRDRGHAILYISHRLGEIFELCESVTVFRNGREVLTGATPDLTRDLLIQAMLGRPLQQMYPPQMEAPADSSVVLEVEGLTLTDVLEDVSFEVRAGEVLCFAGQIGSGANLISRAIAGLVPPDRGQFRWAPGIGRGRRAVSFVSEDRAAEGIFPQLSVRDNLVASSLRRFGPAGWLSWRAVARYAQAIAARVGLDATRLDAFAGNLSGGNQQKVLFGRALKFEGRALLLLNEPTRGVDVGARADLYRLMRSLCAQGYAIIMYSSDLEEVVGMADRLITLYRGRVVGSYGRGTIDLARVLSDITHPRSPMTASAA